MKFAHQLGLALAVLMLLAACRPASATDLIFALTESNLETIFGQNPNFGAGDCGSPAQPATLCAVYQLAIVPNLPGGDSLISASVDSTPASWTDNLLLPDTYEWNAGYTGSNQDVTLLTENSGVDGNTFQGLYIYTGGSRTGVANNLTATEMPENDTFTFTLDTSNAADTIGSLNFNIEVYGVELNSNGTEDELDKQFTYTEDNVLLTPEPSPVWLCAPGVLLAWYGRRRAARRSS